MTRQNLDGLHKMTVKELRAFATDNEINLEGVDRKDHIVERINLALITKEGQENGNDESGNPGEDAKADDTGKPDEGDAPFDIGLSGDVNPEKSPEATGSAGATDPKISKPLLTEIVDPSHLVEELEKLGARATADITMSLTVSVGDENETSQISETFTPETTPDEFSAFFAKVREELKI